MKNHYWAAILLFVSCLCVALGAYIGVSLKGDVVIPEPKKEVIPPGPKNKVITLNMRKKEVDDTNVDIVLSDEFDGVEDANHTRIVAVTAKTWSHFFIKPNDWSKSLTATYRLSWYMGILNFTWGSGEMTAKHIRRGFDNVYLSREKPISYINDFGKHDIERVRKYWTKYYVLERIGNLYRVYDIEIENYQFYGVDFPTCAPVVKQIFDVNLINI